MAQYRKKPVVIDAMQTDGTLTTAKRIQAWSISAAYPSQYNPQVDTCSEMTIDTLEGSMRADEGDWIIRGVKGEFYPCKPDIFDATYEAVGIHD